MYNVQNRKKEYSAEAYDEFSDVRSKGSKYWIIFHLLHGSNKIIVLWIFIGTILNSILSSSLMVVIGYTIDNLNKGIISNLFRNTLFVLVIGLGSPILSLINSLIRETLAQRMERDTRHEFYSNLLGKSQSFHDRQQIGDIMARTTNDVRMLNFLVSPAISLIFESFTGLITPLLFIFFLYPKELLFAPILFIILFIITLRRYLKQLGPVTDKLRNEFGKMNAHLNETLTGIEVVKGSSTEEGEIKKYLKNAIGYRDAFVEQGLIQAKYIPLLLVALVVTIGLGHSIRLNMLGIMEIGQIIAYVGLLGNFRFPTFISLWSFALVRLAISGADRLLEIMNDESDIDENLSGIEKEISGEIRFNNVNFTYPGASQPILRNINFSIKAGQTIAICGTTGSGKTTLTKLISRLYDVEIGEIIIDGINIKNFNLQSLRSQISYIEQDIFLFSSSILDNITFGKTSSLEDVIDVAKEAQAHEFISKLPNGYYSEIGERGVQLSGGERQRIAIARAFLSDPKILILDDSTSAIDSETEDKIQNAISNILKGRTTFLITHRLSQIRWADLILVMKRGEVIAQGSHEYLIRNCEEYRKIFVKRFDLTEEQIIRNTR